MSLITLGIIGLLAALAPLLVRFNERAGTGLIALVLFGIGCWFASVAPGVIQGDTLMESTSWLPKLGVDLAFHIDGLALTFGLLIGFIGSFVLLYASSYLRGDPRLGGFLSTLLAFMFAMLGLVLSDNLIMLFVFWELTSITSYLLIGFDNKRESARLAARQALLTTGLGGLALLAGLVLLGIAAGSFQLSEVLASSLTEHSLYVPIVVLVVLGAFTKSAIFPFHYWLPNAMEAPSPVSALLHSATMVKAGVYLLARLHPSLSGSPEWDLTLTIFGGVTMLSAAMIATRQTQLKKILAYSTVSSLGILVLLIGLDAPKAAAAYLLAHAMFKGCLFLVAGSLTKQTGTKYPEQLGGLMHRTPVLAIAGVLGMLSMAGMVPLLGFAGKELMLKAALNAPDYALLITGAVAISAILTVMVSLIVGLKPFIGPVTEAAQDAKEPDWRQLFGPVALALAGLVAGVAPGLFAEPIASSIIASIHPLDDHPKADFNALKLLYPPTTATWLSLLALSVGTGLFFGRAAFQNITSPFAVFSKLGPARWYDLLLKLLFATASGQTRLLQNGSLQAYVRVVLLVVIGLGTAVVLRTGMIEHLSVSLENITLMDGLLATVLVSAAIASTMQKSALASVAVLGGVGFTITLIFALFGAPDVAMTMFSVETLIVIIFVLVIFHLPKYNNYTTRLRRFVDGSVAGALGLVAGVMTLIVTQQPSPNSVSEFFVDKSVTEGFGRNIVNVILVDFRAMDTLGEVFVIGIAAIGVFTLLRLRPAKAPEQGGEP